MENKFDIRSKTIQELKEFMQEIGENSYRASQIFIWLHKKAAPSFDDMTDLPLQLRKKLSEFAEISKIEAVQRQISRDGTKKYLFKIGDVFVESVLMEYKQGLTVCLSSQAGCRMRCDFCASGITGLERNLTASEILSQLYFISNDVGKRISNIVLMGSGEPLDNFENVLKFIRLVNSDRGCNIGQRHITLSTCGITPKIYELLAQDLQITLAVSLHAPNDAIRKAIMPIANAYHIDDLLQACKIYSQKRRITFEYIMIDGMNDSIADARELASRISDINCHINLIPANKVPGKGYKRASEKNIEAFKKILEKNKIETTIRRELGADIDAACGQLKNKNKNIL